MSFWSGESPSNPGSILYLITGGEGEDLYLITGGNTVKSLKLTGIVFKINGWKTTYMEDFCLSAN